MEIQKIYDQNKYKAAIKEAKEQGPLLASDPLPSTQDTTSAPPVAPAMISTGPSNPGDISTITQDEELRKQLKYIPKLALACQNWVEGMNHKKSN